MTYPNVTKISKAIGTPIVAFDLEHSGGKKEVRGITDFGAIVVLPSGASLQYNSLVKPRPGTQFNPVVTRITGITEHSLRSAPSWAEILDEFILPHQKSIWVGFNSNSCDMPIMQAEAKKFGFQLSIQAHIDLMRLGNLKGTLSNRVSQVVKNFDVTGAHRGLHDAIMTLTLLEHIIPSLSEDELNRCFSTQCSKPSTVSLTFDPEVGSVTAPKKTVTPKKAVVAKKSVDKTAITKKVASPSLTKKTASKAAVAEKVMPKSLVTKNYSFMVRKANARKGAAWSRDELDWVTNAFSLKCPLNWIATSVGRTEVAIVYALVNAKVLPKTALAKYTQPTTEKKWL